MVDTGGQRSKGSACCSAAAVVMPKAVSTSSPSVKPVHGQGLLGSLLLPLPGDPLRDSVHLAGKLASRGYLNDVTPSHLVHIWDQVS
jgi:hypothetical protein